MRYKGWVLIKGVPKKRDFQKLKMSFEHERFVTSPLDGIAVRGTQKYCLIRLYYNIKYTPEHYVRFKDPGAGNFIFSHRN